MAHNEIISKLKDDGAVYRCQGLLDCLTAGELDRETIKAVQGLTTDHTIILGRPISALASAVLDRLGIVPYTGTDQTVLDFIKSL